MVKLRLKCYLRKILHTGQVLLFDSGPGEGPNYFRPTTGSLVPQGQKPCWCIIFQICSWNGIFNYQCLAFNVIFQLTGTHLPKEHTPEEWAYAYFHAQISVYQHGHEASLQPNLREVSYLHVLKSKGETGHELIK